MNKLFFYSPKKAVRPVLFGLLASCSVASIAQSVSIIKPGAPGEEGTILTVAEASQLAGATYTPADADFMRGMIIHHNQALEMAVLVAGRTNDESLLSVSDRIKSSQNDEINFMVSWLLDRGEPVSKTALNNTMHGSFHSNHQSMMGMASHAQMQELASLSGTAFERFFLELMIRHHLGAIKMVDDLHNQPGSAYEPSMYEFTNDVASDQKAEIERMNILLSSLSNDPRATLQSGFRDAGEAIANLRMVSSLEKPAGFFDPENPAGLMPTIDNLEANESGNGDLQRSNDGSFRFSRRPSPLSFANTDIAFSNNMMIAGNYHGFNIYQLGEDGAPNLISSVVCPGGQGDVSIVGDLLLMSVQDSRARTDCGLEGVQGDVSDERFRGLRIFDISDIRNPFQVGLVQTCRGSHTHSIVDVSEDRIVVYNSGTSYVRSEDEMPGCFLSAGDETALFSIDVIEIPLADPASAKITSSPRVFAKDGNIAGLWRGGDHGEGTQNTRDTNQCHDITVFPSLKIAAGACSGNGIILDISDPYEPKRVTDVTDPGFAYWHSATFNNDGTKVIFTDEWGGGSRPRCQAGDPKNWGGNAIYRLRDETLTFQSYYKIPAPQTDKENCVAHNGSVVPVPGRDIFVQAWYQGGISLIDFTDAEDPIEIAYFDRGPVNEDQLITGGYWSAYWYNGRIYATEITRGLDVFALEPSEFLTSQEIAAAEAAEHAGGVFNPQTQTRISWPENLVEALKLNRDGA
jgi:uncharacterized protein (DUF305 family)